MKTIAIIACLTLCSCGQFSASDAKAALYFAGGAAAIYKDLRTPKVQVIHEK